MNSPSAALSTHIAPRTLDQSARGDRPVLIALVFGPCRDGLANVAQVELVLSLVQAAAFFRDCRDTRRECFHQCSQLACVSVTGTIAAACPRSQNLDPRHGSRFSEVRNGRLHENVSRKRYARLGNVDGRHCGTLGVRTNARGCGLMRPAAHAGSNRWDLPWRSSAQS